MKFVKTVKADLIGGLAKFDLELLPGVNFIAGENGTGKSRLLEFVKSQINTTNIIFGDTDSVAPDRVAFYNPKRNLQKKDVVGLLEQSLREGKSKQTIISQLNQNYAEQFTEYPNTSDLFVLTVNDVILSENKTPNNAVNIVKRDFAKIIKAVLPYFEIEAHWDKSNRQPSLMFQKYGSLINPMLLSVGENEIFSLTFSIYSSREAFDIYLIDEPEIHLNWSLEKNLFDFLDSFARKEEKQIIVSTHSPVVFEKKFIDKTTFLIWDNNKINISKNLSEELTKNLSSRVANTIVKLDDAFDQTFFVEDEIHKEVIESISKLKSINVQAIPVGDKKRVIDLHGKLKDKISAYFMVDGDNDAYNNKKLNGKIFALEKYCIENYLMNFNILSSISKNKKLKTADQIKDSIISKVINNKNPEFKKRYMANIALAKLNKKEFFKILDYMDGSQFITENISLYRDLGYTNTKLFIDSYVECANKEKKLEIIFREILDKLKK